MSDQGPVDTSPAIPPAATEETSTYVPPAAPEGAVAAKPDLGKRAIAAIIDGAIAAVVGLIPVIGNIIGALYVLTRDGFDYDFMDGRSAGKKLMKLRPVRLDGQKMDIRTSIRRNWPLALGSLAFLFLFIPVLGWLLYPLLLIAAIGLGITELVLVLTSADGRRFGDKLGGTQVIEVDE